MISLTVYSFLSYFTPSKTRNQTRIKTKTCYKTYSKPWKHHITTTMTQRLAWNNGHARHPNSPPLRSLYRVAPLRKYLQYTELISLSIPSNFRRCKNPALTCIVLWVVQGVERRFLLAYACVYVFVIAWFGKWWVFCFWYCLE